VETSTPGFKKGKKLQKMGMKVCGLLSFWVILITYIHTYIYGLGSRYSRVVLRGYACTKQRFVRSRG
jgi:hypothetical protein